MLSGGSKNISTWEPPETSLFDTRALPYYTKLTLVEYQGGKNQRIKNNADSLKRQYKDNRKHSNEI